MEAWQAREDAATRKEVEETWENIYRSSKNWKLKWVTVHDEIFKIEVNEDGPGKIADMKKKKGNVGRSPGIEQNEG